MLDCEVVGGWGGGCGGVCLGLCDKGIRVFGGAEEVGLAALTDSFHNKWFVRSIGQPRLECFFYLPFIHIITFSCRLFDALNTLSCLLSVKRCTFSCIQGKCLQHFVR